MGINSLYQELGKGHRIALSKLVVEHYERTNRPFRLAVDVSIWSFQNQAANGGSNPELRTLYYRLVRLLSLSIQPLFVFDGPNKPPFKRGKKANPNAGTAAAYFTQHTKELLRLFGFPIHQAPGEAEAECAALQQLGIVDAVLSEDVDTLMFGCTMHLRNWSSAGTKRKTATHVDLYRAQMIRDQTKLDREGMILVAMMSGGDYLPGGLRGCGAKTACEAARAGFGEELCKLSNDNEQGLKQWRDWLQHELSTNEGGHFKTSHKNINIPDDFPDKLVLGYYTHPVVSSPEEMDQISKGFRWHQDIDVPQLRLFVAEMFEWQNLNGARKFIRTLAPALLVRRLCQRASGSPCNPHVQELEEKKLIKSIYERRHHFDTDATAELRIGFIPIEIVKINLEEERINAANVDNGSGSDSDPDEASSKTTGQGSHPSPRKPRISPPYNPCELQRHWVMESFVKLGVPLMAETWEEEEQDMRKAKNFALEKAKGTEAKAKPKVKSALGGMKPGALDSFVRFSKPGVLHPAAPNFMNTSASMKSTQQSSVEILIPSKPNSVNNTGQGSTEVGKKSIKQTIGKRTLPAPASVITHPGKNDNPWTKSKRPPETYDVRLTSGKRYSALGIYGSQDVTPRQKSSDDIHAKELNESPSASRKHTRQISSSPARELLRSRDGRKEHRLEESLGDDAALANLDTPTPGESDAAQPRPSPEKRCSPSRVHLPQTLRTPKTNRGRKQDGLGDSNLRPTARQANRKLDFEGPKQSPGHLSDSDSLPSPSLLFSVNPSQSTRRSSVSPSPSKRSKNPQTSVAVRESLEEAWRHAESREAAGKSTKAMASVDVVDLTGD